MRLPHSPVLVAAIAAAFAAYSNELFAFGDGGMEAASPSSGSVADAAAIPDAGPNDDSADGTTTDLEGESDGGVDADGSVGLPSADAAREANPADGDGDVWLVYPNGADHRAHAPCAGLCAGLTKAGAWLPSAR
jgi:hypothetical protein